MLVTLTRSARLTVSCPRRQARLKGAVEVPIFVTEESNDPVSLLKKMSAWSMGGFWLGGTHMKPNSGFVRQVAAAIPKDSRVVLACQKGLRYVSPPCLCCTSAPCQVQMQCTICSTCPPVRDERCSGHGVHVQHVLMLC